MAQSKKKSPACETCVAIEILMDEIVENIEDYMHGLAHNQTDELTAALGIPDKDLALHVNDTGIALEVVKRRLKGEPADVPALWLQTLYDLELDYDIMSQINVNDGELAIAIRVYDKLGKIKQLARAQALVYSD